MTGSVIERLGYEVVEQEIIFSERTLTWGEADKRAGFRLDRRKRWAFIKSDMEGVPDLCDCVEWTAECSECRSYGCKYCGYTGRECRSNWVPYLGKDDEVAA